MNNWSCVVNNWGCVVDDWCDDFVSVDAWGRFCDDGLESVDVIGGVVNSSD
jgi:hypothetical protein